MLVRLSLCIVCVYVETCMDQADFCVQVSFNLCYIVLAKLGRVSPKVGVLLSGIVSQTLDLENFTMAC